MISDSDNKKSISLNRSNRHGWLRRVKTSVILAVLLFTTAAQTLHHHGGFQPVSSSVHSSGVFETSPSPARLSDSQDDCLICQLQGQYSSVHIFHQPRVVLSLEIKPVRAAVFFSSRIYRSAASLPTGGRAPPLPFLS